MLKKFAFLLALCSILRLGAVCNPYTIPTYMTGYVPFTIVNNSNTIASSSLYVTISGTNPATNNTCMVQLNMMSGQYVGTLVDCTNAMFSVNLNSLEYSYLVSSFPTQNGQPVIYLPNITNATFYLSVGYPMGLQTSTGAPYNIQAPQPFTVTDPNYYHLWDSSVFFTLGDHLNFQSSYLTSFGLPISAIISINGGTSVQYAGINVSRSTILTSFATAISNVMNTSAQAQWEKLPFSFTSASGGGVTELRVASTTSAMTFTTSPFDVDYLTASSSPYGADWATVVFGITNVYFDVSALPPPPSLTSYTTYLYTGVSGGNLVFQPQGGGTTVYVPYPFPNNSIPFLNAAATGGNSFNASGDTAATPLICEYLSAGFVTGLFPVSNTSPSNPFGDDYLALANVNGQIYKNNAVFPSSSGPWYDLYGQVLHGASQGTSYINFEADVVDVYLGYFNPIVVRNNSNAQPAVFVVLEDCTSTVVPNFTDSTMYNILIASSANNTILLNGMPAPVGMTTVSVPFTLTITYMTGNFNGFTYTTEVLVNATDNYSVVFPQPPGVITPENMGSFWNIAISDSP